MSASDLDHTEVSEPAKPRLHERLDLVPPWRLLFLKDRILVDQRVAPQRVPVRFIGHTAPPPTHAIAKRTEDLASPDYAAQRVPCPGRESGNALRQRDLRCF